MKKIIAILLVGLVTAVVYLGVRVFTLERDLYRALSAAQSGLLSVQRICKPIVGLVRSSDPGDASVRELSFRCLGPAHGEHDYAEYDAKSEIRDPEQRAAYIERRLYQQRLLPWQTSEPVKSTLLPAMIFDGSWIP